MNDLFSLPVHPAAEVFPMLPPDELAELAEDIKVNGLAHPIVVKAGVLIDGRNRREACRIAGVEPRTVELNGQDATAFILSSNIARRHLTKGQRAMATAMLYPDTQQGRRDTSPKNGEVGPEYVRMARVVRRAAPDLAASVLSGVRVLDEAYAEVLRQRQAAQADETRLARLTEVAPDLAELVREGRINLMAAETERDERAEKRRRQTEADVRAVLALAQQLDDLAGARMQRVAALHSSNPEAFGGLDLIASIPRWIAVIDQLQEQLQ
jgi:hypothetical protein